ncbi:MAG TPA: molybdopterin molybdenumtransferase MoeA, partial [Candidatus Eisenbacteria bacterium]|nr:molybdopterin molybdenumtransferase MoeA [Candidatus Eisenbacteria bacterium]
GLPGNPVSSAVVFDRLARPLLRAAMGAEIIERPMTRATLAEPVRSGAGRRDFVRVRLDGGRARLTGSQSSGAVTSLAKADGLAVIPEDTAELPVGAEVDVILWR